MIDQPTIANARDLENMIDNYRLQITAQEQSIIQNKKLLVSQEYTIGQNDLKIKEQDTFIETKTAQSQELSRLILKKEEEETLLTSNLKELNANLSAIKAEIASGQAENAKYEDSLKSKEGELNKREIDISRKEDAITLKEKIVADKHTKIKDFVNELK